MIKKSIIGFGFAALAIAGCKGDGGGATDTLAVVNGSIIPMSMYYKTLERKASVTAIVNPNSLSVDPRNGRVTVQIANVQVRPSLAFQALQECIANEIVQQVAKDEGLYPKETDVEAEIKLQEERNPNFVKDASKEGLSIDQIKDLLRLELARLNLQAEGVSVTDAEIDAYIKANPAQFTQPASADLLFIEVPDQKTKDLADKELNERQMFATVAQHYSVQKNGKAEGFKFPVRNINEMTVALQKLIAETREFTATKWVYDDASKHWLKFYIQRKTKAEPIKISNYVRQVVKRQLLKAKGSRANDPARRVADKLKASKIEIKVKYLEEPWKKAFSDMTKSAEGQTPAAAK